MKKSIAKICLEISLVLGLLGLLITFYPGAECQWFALSAILAFPSIFISSYKYKVSASVLILVFVTFSIQGYYRGKEYEKSLVNQQNHIEKQAPLETR